MKSTTTVRRVVLSIIGVLITVAVVATAISVQAASTKPGITVQISPASQSVQPGAMVTYMVTLTSTGGFAGSVVLNATGLPSSSTASFSPPAPTLTAAGTNSTASSTLSLLTTSSTPVGSYTLSVTGTSGKISGNITAGLTVNSPPPGSLSMSATPTLVAMDAGSTATYAVQLVRTNLTGSNVTLAVSGGLPADATSAFTPNPTTGNSSTLTVTTTAKTLDGTYTLSLVASGEDANGLTRYGYTSVQLAISTKGKSFTISGDLSGLLAPGTTLPLELSLWNPNKKSLSVTNLSVALQSVTRTQFAIDHNLICDIRDYAVTQYSGLYPLVIPGSSSTSLSSTSLSPLVPTTQWPQITFRDDTAINQDGCKGATLNLSYSGSAQGN